LKKTAGLMILLMLLGASLPLSSEPLSEQRQQELLDVYDYMRGEGPLPESQVRCGTEIAFQLFINRDNFTGEYAARLSAVQERPAGLSEEFTSPAGMFKIHYTTSTSNSVYLPLLDTLDGGDGVPDYVNKVAELADSVWEFEVNHLGFPAPPSDGTGGGDSLMDIYILNLGSSYYGYTEAVPPVITNQSVASFIVIDNDFDIPPYSQSSELNRRLDAARVTVAHEFFHTIHYGMDYTEYEGTQQDPKLYWWEMSAVWMEEMAFDQVNDYYYYLPWFLEYPWIGLQGVPIFNVYHQYGGAIFPIFLTEKFDTVVVRLIWENCRDFGVGSQFPRAANDAIRSLSLGTYDLLSAYQEFAIWNLFTGSMTDRAPNGFRYSEASNYALIPDTGVMLNFNQYEGYRLIWEWPETDTLGDPIILADGTPISFFIDHMPQNLSAHYINMQNISLLTDTLFGVYFYGDTRIDWGISFIGFPPGGTAPAEVIETHRFVNGDIIEFLTPTDLYSRIVAIPTPVDTNITAFPETYGYTLVFRSSALEEFEDRHVFFSPYPNPIRVDSDDDFVTFKARIITSSLIGRLARMEVTILNVAGEKVNVLHYPTSGEFEAFGNEEEAIVTWKLDNRSEREVSAGVYLAFCQLLFGDGTPSASEKYKIAVIK
jgi:hypothetical protein